MKAFSRALVLAALPLSLGACAGAVATFSLLGVALGTWIS